MQRSEGRRWNETGRACYGAHTAEARATTIDTLQRVDRTRDTQAIMKQHALQSLGKTLGVSANQARMMNETACIQSILPLSTRFVT